MGSVYSPTPGAGVRVSEGHAVSRGLAVQVEPEAEACLAASAPFWEAGLVPRNKSSSGEVEKTSLLGADMVKWA